MKYSKGFTLIELLVVVAIIGLLSGIISTSLGTAKIRSRDAKRMEDLGQIKIALELYYNTYGTYPPTKPQTNCGGSDAVWASSRGNCGGQWLTTDTNFYTFMNSVPVDPRNANDNASVSGDAFVYNYYRAVGGNEYDLITQLEDPENKNRCGTSAAFYHGQTPRVPWCAPWSGNLGRSANIYADHF